MKRLMIRISLAIIVVTSMVLLSLMSESKAWAQREAITASSGTQRQIQIQQNDLDSIELNRLISDATRVLSSDGLLPEPEFKPFILEAVRTADGWALVNYASYPSDSSLPESVELVMPNLVLGIGRRSQNGDWKIALRTQQEFYSWLADVPDTLLDNEAKEILQSLNPAMAPRAIDAVQVPGLPYPVGQAWRYNRGPHESWSTYSSLDFGTPTHDVSARVYAAETGVIINTPNDICLGVQRGGDGLIIWYQHIQKSDIDDFMTGQTISFGQSIGMTTKDDGHPEKCKGSSTGHHVHLSWQFQRNQSYNPEGSSFNGWVVVGQELQKNGVVVKAGKNQTVLHSADGDVGGRILNSSNLPMPNAEVKIVDINEHSQTTTTDNSGWYRFHNVFAGHAKITAISSGMAGEASMTVRAYIDQQAPDIKLTQKAYCPVPTSSRSANSLESDDSTTIDCVPLEVDGARFTGVESPADNAIFSTGQSFRKTWQVRNTGTSTWGAGYQLVFTGGTQMGGPTAVNVPTATPGQTVEISVNLAAPGRGGTYRGDWRLRNNQGTYFGDALWVQIKVPDQSAPPPSGSDIVLECTNCPREVVPGTTFRPTIRATVNRGQLLESRGDMLRHKSGDSFGAWPHIAVTGSVGQGGTYDFTFYTDAPIRAPNSDGTYRTTWQVWQDGRWAGQELTIEFKVKTGSSGNNHRPNRPSLDSPADWKVYYSGNKAQLCARSNGDPDGDAVTHYYFEIFESAQNWSSGWTTNSCVTTSSLKPYNYQWRAKVRDSRGLESEWSNETWHFTIVDPNLKITQLYVENTNTPGVVRIRACTEGQGSVGITMKVSVNSATDGSDRGEWRTLKELGVPCFNAIDAPTWNYLEYASGKHRIRAEAHGSQTGWDGATVREITYDIPASSPPSPPRISEPLWDSYVTSGTVTFRWEPVMRANTIRVQLATDPNYNSMVLDQSLAAGATSYTHTFATSYPILYGRVLAIGSYGTNEGRLRFRMDTEAPSSTMTALPSTVTNAAFPVSWSGTDNLSGIRWYQVQVRDGDRDGSAWEDWYEQTTLTSDTFVGQPGHTYYFRARAMDKVGHWEEWSTGDEGDTHTRVDSDAGTSGTSDLAVVALETHLPPEGDVIVQVTFENQGDVATANGFYTDLYVDHLPTGSGDYTGSLRFWINDPVAAGDQVILTTVLEEEAILSRASGPRQPLAPASEVTATLYAQVDSAGVIRESDNDNNISEGAELCLATPDQYEGSDANHTNAPYIDAYERQVHNFHRPEDEDWVRFYAWEGNTYVLHTYGLDEEADTYLYLYAEDGSTLLASNDDAGALASQITWTAPNSGTYYLRVRQWNPNSGGCGTRYILALLPLQLITDLTLTPSDPMVGEPVTATLTVESTAPMPIVLDHIGIGSHGPECSDWDCGRPHDFPWQNDIVISPGIPYTYQTQRVFTEQGQNYFAQMLYGLSEKNWYSVGTQLNFDVGPGLRADSSVSLLPAAPVAGETIAATYRVRNDGPRPLALAALGLVARGPNCATWECPWNDFPHYENIILQPGQTYTYQGQRSFSEAGSGYFAEPGFADPNGWWFPVPESARANFEVSPGLVVVGGPTLEPATPAVGEMVTAEFTIRNDAAVTLTAHRLAMAVQGPDCTDWSCNRPQDFRWLSDISLEPGESYTYRAQRPFLAPGDQYFAQIMYGFGEEDWLTLGPRIDFSVQSGLTLANGITLSPGAPIMSEQVTATYIVRNDATHTIHIPAFGVVARGPGCTHWECGPAVDFPQSPNIELASGATYTYTESRSFADEGNYFAVPAFSDPQGGWYPLPGASQFSFTVGVGIELTADLVLSPADPQVGEIVTGSFTLRNASDTSITLSHLGIGGRGPGCDDWSCTISYQDFPWKEALTLAPGESYTYEGKRLFNTQGDYFVQITYGFKEDEWYHAGSEYRFTVGQGLQIAETLTLTPDTPIVGEPVTARYVINNSGTHSIALPYLGLVARGPNCDTWECVRTLDFPHEEDITLAPGDTYIFTAMRSFPEPGDGFFAQAAYGDPNGWWYPLPGAERLSFEVVDGYHFRTYLPLTIHIR